MSNLHLQTSRSLGRFQRPFPEGLSPGLSRPGCKARAQPSASRPFQRPFRQASRRLRRHHRSLNIRWLKPIAWKAGEPALEKFWIALDPRPRKAGATTLRERPLKAAWTPGLRCFLDQVLKRHYGHCWLASFDATVPQILFAPRERMEALCIAAVAGPAG